MTKIRKNLFVILSVCLMISFGAFFATATSTAKAENSATVNVETVLMDEGASVRLVEPAGIRFRLFVNKDYFDGLTNPEVGMYIALADDTTETEMQDISTIPENAMFYRAEMFAEVDAETKAFSAVIYDIPNTEYGTKLIANGYIKAENGTEVFAANPQTRSIAQTASIFLSQGVDDDALKTYVDGVVTEENFKLTNTAISTDVYKTAEPSIGVVAPEDLVVIYESSNENVVAVDENGNLTRGGALGTAEITATLGTTELTATVKVDEPAVLRVDENTASNIDWNGGERKATYVENLDFAGGYTGGAAKIRTQTNSLGYYVVNNYSIEELNAIANNYTHVNMWIAHGELTQGQWSFNAIDDGGESFTTKLAMNHDNGYKFKKESTDDLAYSCKTWYKVTLPIADYIDLLTDENGEAKKGCHLMSVWQYNTITEGNDHNLYFGDIFFSTMVYTVGAKNHTNIYNSDGVQKIYVRASELVKLGIAGNYVGNAVKFNLVTGCNNGGYRVTNTFTKEQLLEIKEEYSHISVWMAATGIKSSSVPSYAADAYPNYFAVKAGGISFNSTAEWKKISVTIDDYIALLELTNYAYVPLIRTASYNAPTFDEAGAWMYVGDIFFENLA